MARQNVGNPKFYIDMLSYWRTRGNVKGVGIANLGNTPGSGGYAPQLIGLNPTDWIQQPFAVSPDDEQVPIALEYQINLNRRSSISDRMTNTMFFGILGHNLMDFQLMNFNLFLQDQNQEYIYFSDDDGYDEICNFDPINTRPLFNGWSLGTFRAIVRDVKFIKFMFEGLMQIGTSAQALYTGSLCFGHVFQMPHSPDLNLTMPREYDGIRDQNTRGGSTITQINYTNPPDWVGFPAWELSEESAHANVISGIKEIRSPSRGRRIWDLEFSYVHSSDMFPVNELYGRGNPTDSDTNPDAGYAQIPFDSDGNFFDNTETDSSFFSMLMEKTMGGALKFLFQPDGNNNSPDQFSICKIDQTSIQIEQVASNVYNIGLKIRECW